MTTLNKHKNISSKLIYENHNLKDIHLSIVIPTFQRPQYLRQALLSIDCLNFSFLYEVVVIDNDIKSSDITMNILSEFQDLPLRLFSNESNIGMIGNWNRCLELASGEYITILNDDDLLLDGWPEYVASASKNKELIGCYFKRFTEFEKDILLTKCKTKKYSSLKPLNIKSFFLGLWTNGSLGTIFHRDSCINLGGFNEDIFPISDWDFYVRYFRSYGGYITNLKLTGFRWEVNESLNPETIKKYITSNEKFRNQMIEKGYLKRKSFYKLLTLIIKIKMIFYARKKNASIKEEELLPYLKDTPSHYLILRYLPMRIIRILTKFF